MMSELGEIATTYESGYYRWYAANRRMIRTTSEVLVNPPDSTSKYGRAKKTSEEKMGNVLHSVKTVLR